MWNRLLGFGAQKRRSTNLGRRPAIGVEQLEDRAMLSAYGMMLGRPVPIPDWIPEERVPEIQERLAQITHTGSTAPAFTLDAESNAIIKWNDFILDPQYGGANGFGYSVVVIDTGIDINHPFFGPDDFINGTDPPNPGSDGVADRIVYQQDFANNDMNASDFDGHGTHVTSIAAGFQDGVYAGIAPAADIIALKVFSDAGSSQWGDVEAALQWVIENWQTYDIAAVNMSLGDHGNYSTPPVTDLYGLQEEIDSIVNDFEIPVIVAAGNDFYQHGSAQGLQYPAAEASAIAVGNTWDSLKTTQTVWPDENGNPTAIDFTADVDRISGSSQRHVTMLDVLAPGVLINGAQNGGGMTQLGGTSMSAPHVAGTAVLARQLWDLHRKTPSTPFLAEDFRSLLRTTGPLLLDGDDEDDNVTNSNESWHRLDVAGLMDEIVLPRVSQVIINSTFQPMPQDNDPAYFIPSGSGAQIATVPVAMPTQVIVDFTEPVGTMQGGSVQLGNLQANNMVLAEDGGFGAGIDVVSVTEVPLSNTMRFIWTLNGAYSDRAQVGMVISDVIVDGAGNALDGDWTMPASFSDQSAEISEYPSGNKTPGGDLTFGFTLLPGDANSNNVIDIDDLNAVRNNFGSGTTWQEGDFDGDNDVDIDELNLVRNNFGFDDYLTWPTAAPLTGGGSMSSTAVTKGSQKPAPVGEEAMKRALRGEFDRTIAVAKPSEYAGLFGWDKLGDVAWWDGVLGTGWREKLTAAVAPASDGRAAENGAPTSFPATIEPFAPRVVTLTPATQDAAATGAVLEQTDFLDRTDEIADDIAPPAKSRQQDRPLRRSSRGHQIDAGSLFVWDAALVAFEHTTPSVAAQI